MNQAFPVLASVLSPEALAQEVLPGFGVGEIGRCRFHSGGFNHTYRVTTAQGALTGFEPIAWARARWRISGTSLTSSTI
jgi:hypothetical protein